MLFERRRRDPRLPGKSIRYSHIEPGALVERHQKGLRHDVIGDLGTDPLSRISVDFDGVPTDRSITLLSVLTLGIAYSRRKGSRFDFRSTGRTSLHDPLGLRLSCDLARLTARSE